jgi:ABC-type transporter Mla subunit MlaD
MAQNEIVFEILAQTAEATKEIAAFQKKTEKSLNSISDSVKNVSFASLITALNATFELAGKAFDAVAGALTPVIDAAVESEDNLAKLNSALALSGRYSAETSAQFEDLASQLEATTRFSDDAVISAAALAQRYAKSTEQSKALVKAAADLSAATGQDLNSSVEALGKTLDGTAGRIGEAIPELQGLSANALKSGEAIDVVAQRFRGAADAMGATFSGRVTQAKNAFDNILETIGKFITQNPVVIGVIGLLSGAFKEINAFFVKNTATIKQFISDGLVGLAGFIPKVVSGFNDLLRILRPVALGLEFVALGALAVVDAFLQFSHISDLLGFIASGLGQLTGVIVDLLGKFAGLPGVSDFLKEIGIDSDALSKSLEGTAESVDRFSKGISGEKIRAGSEKTVESVNKLIDATKSGFDSASVSIDKFQKKTEKIAETVANLSKPGAGTGITKTIQNVVKSISPLFEFIKANIQLIEDGLKGLSSVTKGKQGAKALAQTGSAAGITALTGSKEAGAAAGEIVSVLSEGPSKVKAMVDEFARGIPEIVKNIALAIPALVEALIVAIPEIIIALVDALPEIVDNFVTFLVERLPEVISAFVARVPEIINHVVADLPRIATALVALMPRIANALAFSLIANAPAIASAFIRELILNTPKLIFSFAEELAKLPGRLIDELARGINDIFKGIGGGVGGAVGGIVSGGGGILSDIGDFFGFADGGLVPSGFNNDTFPARLTSGELVIERDTTQKLDQFLNGQGSNQSPVVVQLFVGEKQLADVMLDLNRKGFRTA